MSQKPLNPDPQADHHDLSSYLQRILRARVYDVAIESPLDQAPNL